MHGMNIKQVLYLLVKLTFLQKRRLYGNACVSKKDYIFPLTSYLKWKPVTNTIGMRSGQRISIVLTLKAKVKGKVKATKNHALLHT
jgi:hypothetical protein